MPMHSLLRHSGRVLQGWGNPSAVPSASLGAPDMHQHYQHDELDEFSPIGEEVAEDYWTMFLYASVFAMAIFLVLGICWLNSLVEATGFVAPVRFAGFLLGEQKEEYQRTRRDSVTGEVMLRRQTSEPLAVSRLRGGLAAVLLNPFNLLLVFVPLGITSHLLQWAATYTFLLNLLALLPLSNLMGEATEDLALHTGQTIGGLLSATFGNAVELIIVVQSLRQGLIEVTKGTMLGSILANELLVLGMAFLFGGIFQDGKPVRNKMQRFSPGSAMVQAHLLLFSAFVICMPSMFKEDHHVTRDHVLKISRVGSVFTLLGYMVYLFFQLSTHDDVLRLDRRRRRSEEGEDSESEDEVEEEPRMFASSATLLLLVSSVMLTCCTGCLVHAIEGFTRSVGFSEIFVGVVLLPIVSNACEHSSAVVVAMKDKLDLAIGISLGSTIQISLFVLPFAVVAGWLLDQPMDLNFDDTNAWGLVLSAQIVICVLVTGRSNWLNGFILIATYCVLAIMYFFTPNKSMET